MLICPDHSGYTPLHYAARKAAISPLKVGWVKLFKWYNAIIYCLDIEKILDEQNELRW